MDISIPKAGVILICGPTTTGKSSCARKILEKSKRGVIISQANNINIKNDIESSLKMLRMLEKAIDKKKLSILVDDSFIYNSRISSMIAIVRILGYEGPITVIKMNLDYELHVTYWKNRKNGKKISLKALKKQREIFEKESLHEDFSKFVTEYTVDDPNKMNFIFC